MISGESASARNRVAILLSLALHALALTVLFVMPREYSDASIAPRELETRVLPVRLRIEHRQTAIALAPPPAPTSDPRPKAAPLRAVARPHAALPHTTRTALSLPTRTVDPDVRHHDRGPVPAAAAAVADDVAPVVAGSAPASPVAIVLAPAALSVPPTPGPPAAAPPVAKSGEIASAAMGPPGANYRPTLLPPGSEGPLRSLAGGHFRVQVAIDERGRATGLRWLLAIADEATRDRIGAQLLAARYVPAECDGLPCADVYDLRN